MELILTKLLETLVLPPTGLILLGIMGLLLARYRQSAGHVMIWLALLTAYLISTPLIAGGLIALLQNYPALNPADLKDDDESTIALNSQSADAIVILAGGRNRNALEFGTHDSVNTYSLERLRYGAFLHRKTKLPILISGGIVRQDSMGKAERPEALLIKEVLENEFDVSVSYTEEESHTTFENAKYSAPILRQNGLQTIYLVTTAAHMPRAVEAFEHFGIKVIPAPTAFYGNSGQDLSINDFLPNPRDQYMSAMAIHEIIGRWWYHLRYY